jgi:hypothetical protein
MLPTFHIDVGRIERSMPGLSMLKADGMLWTFPTTFLGAALRFCTSSMGQKTLHLHY